MRVQKKIEKKCVKLHYNWRQCGEAGDQWGDDYDIHEVGKNGVARIYIDLTKTSGIWVVDYEDGRQEYIYNPNQVFFEPDDKYCGSGSESSGLILRTDTERLNWLEAGQKCLYRVITIGRKPTTTTEPPHYEEYSEFLGWCVEGRDDEMSTVREAIDAAMDA
jgi:hypothetical protein